MPSSRAFDLTLLSLLCVLAAWSSVLVAAIAWRRREIPGGRSLVALMAATAQWSLGAAVELSSAGVPAKVFWSKFEYLGTVTAPVLLLFFAIEYARYERWLNRRTIAATLAVPALMLALAFTNERHGWIWSGFRVSPAGFNLLIYDHGPAFALFAAYSHLCVILAFLLVALTLPRFPPTHRRQTVAVLVAIALPWLANVAYLAQWLPVVGLDLTPISFAGMGVVLVVAILRFRLLEVAPVPNDLVIERMNDGLILLDGDGRLAVLNPAARRMLGAGVQLSPGRTGAELLAAWPGMLVALEADHETREEIVAGGRVVEIQVTPLGERGGRRAGHLLLLREITARRRAERALAEANERLREKLEEIEKLQATLREQALRDALTGLYNRRYLEDALERELARARRERAPLSVALIDLDRFKETNDTLGHQAADEVLRRFGALLAALTRQSDVACRYGGDEFVVLMPGAPLDHALARAEQWRSAFAEAAAAALG
ncbi:MAG: diguanylate cyclase, partial [Thermoanaerobaculia bacterium]